MIEKGAPVSASFRTTTLCALGIPRSIFRGKLAIHFRPAALQSPPTNAGMAMIRFVGSRYRR
jgi:hypothetical protein